MLPFKRSLQGENAWKETGPDIFLPWEGLEEKTVVMMMKIKKLSMINDHEDYDILNAITDIKVQSRINGYQRVKRNGQVPVPSVLHACKADEV